MVIVAPSNCPFFFYSGFLYKLLIEYGFKVAGKKNIKRQYLHMFFFIFSKYVNTFTEGGETQTILNYGQNE